MKKWILIILLIVGAAFIGTSVVAVKMANKIIEEKKQNILGLALEIKSYSVDWKRARLVLNGIAIYPTGKVDAASELASADKLIMEVSLLDVITKKELHTNNIIFERPKITYQKISNKKNNWDVLDLSELKGEKKEENKDGWKIRIDKISINDGFVSYVDRAEGGRLDLNKLDMKVSNIVTEPDPTILPTDIDMSAQVGSTSGKIEIDGKANLIGKGLNFKLNAKLSGTPITYFAPFYAGSTPFSVNSGTISAKSTANAKESMLESSHNVNLSALHVSGGLKGKMVDTFLEQAGRSVNINASVNGNLEKGDISVSTSTARAISDQLVTKAIANATFAKPTELIKKGGEELQKIPKPRLPSIPKF